MHNEERILIKHTTVLIDYCINIKNEKHESEEQEEQAS